MGCGLLVLPQEDFSGNCMKHCYCHPAHQHWGAVHHSGTHGRQGFVLLAVVVFVACVCVLHVHIELQSKVVMPLYNTYNVFLRLYRSSLLADFTHSY